MKSWHGRFLTARSNNRCYATSTRAGPNEYFDIVFTGRGKGGWNLVPGFSYVALRTRYGRYIRGLNTGRVDCHSIVVGPWEKWRIFWTGRGHNGWHLV